MGISLYCNVNEEGKIIESVVGERLLPTKQYDYFFYITDLTADEITDNISKYRIVDRALTLQD